MMSLETIHERNREAAVAAAQNSEQPLIVTKEDIDDGAVTGIPVLGDLLPTGWKRIDLSDWYGEDSPHGVNYGDADGAGAFFVDSSGLGDEGEPALTINEFLSQLRQNYGYAIVEAGQFQVKVGVFERVTN